jgi:hypothetical protein
MATAIKAHSTVRLGVAITPSRSPTDTNPVVILEAACVPARCAFLEAVNRA